MSISETNRYFVESAVTKFAMLRSNPFGFFISAMLAGAYVGIGIILIISVGEHADPSLKTLLMGASFGVALTLVIFAGSELYTGYTMYMTQGVLSGETSLSQLLLAWSVVWIGNLAGCLVLAAIAVIGDIDIVSANGELLQSLAAKKAKLEVSEMIARGILCNWLVCLAIWTSARTKNDAAKLILIFWCLFAFIASGFEHSVANMTVFSLALLSDQTATITVADALKNLTWVTVGNTISGVAFVAGAYWSVGRGTHPVRTDRKPATEEVN